MSAFQIEGFTDSSPAKEAGLQLGDILLAVNGEEFDSIDDLVAGISQKGGGFTVSFYRNGRQFDAEIKGERLGCSLVRQAVPESVVQAKRDAESEARANRDAEAKKGMTQEEIAIQEGRLISCPTCGGVVSVNASSCPKCGEVILRNAAPTEVSEKSGTSPLAIAGIGLGVFVATLLLMVSIIKDGSSDSVSPTYSGSNGFSFSRLVSRLEATGASTTSVSEHLPYNTCLTQLEVVKGKYPLAREMSLGDVGRILRIQANDGAILVTCSKPDQRIVLTKS